MPGKKCFIFSLLNCLALLISLRNNAQSIVPYNGPFPVPPINKNRLFYLQRTINRNTLIYEINYNADGAVNRKNPVIIYWIDYDNGEKISQLTYIQNKFAYGIVSDEIKEAKTLFKINLVSYKKIDMYLKPTGKNGSYEMHVIINGKPCILDNILIHITGGTYLKPVVSSIELTGKELFTGKEVVEKIKP